MSNSGSLVSSASSSHVQLEQLTSTLAYMKILESSPKYQKYYQIYKGPTNAKARHIEDRLTANFTGHVMMGPNKVNLRSPSLYIINDHWLSFPGDIGQGEAAEDNYAVTFFNLGNNLTGHPGIIHGGCLATLLDELTCRVAFQNFHLKAGVTANLNINYRKPTVMETFVMIKCFVEKKEGRKCWVKGEVYSVGDLNGDDEIETKENLLVECLVLVIEPKWVNSIGNERK